MSELTNEQQIVMDNILKWFRDAKEQWLTVAGNAGTGKSFLLSHLPKLLSYHIRLTYCCYTGKASSVLLNKLSDIGINNINVSTIHKLMYTPKIKNDEEGYEYIDGWLKNEDIPYDLIVIDEASMVNEEIFKDLLSYGLPILCVGDHGQLPPVSSNGFSLMKSPEYILKTIHRQAAGSPIIQLSKYIRENGNLPKKLNNKYVKEIIWWKKKDREFFNKIPFLNKNIITISALNKSRKYFNEYIRGLCGYSNANIINKGERVVCLKNNDVMTDNGIYYVMNGVTGSVDNIVNTKYENFSNLYVDFDIHGDVLPCISNVKCFGEIDRKKLSKIGGDPRGKQIAKSRGQNKINLFDYGYCITCHKSQGSEWPCVIVINERSGYTTDDDYKRWLYTSVTRSSHRLFIINGY